MKLAEALQEGETPHEPPDELLMQAFGVLAELEDLVSRINKTNLAAKLADGRSLTDAIAHRQRNPMSNSAPHHAPRTWHVALFITAR